MLRAAVLASFNSGTSIPLLVAGFWSDSVVLVPLCVCSASSSRAPLFFVRRGIPTQSLSLSVSRARSLICTSYPQESRIYRTSIDHIHQPNRCLHLHRTDSLRLRRLNRRRRGCSNPQRPPLLLHVESTFIPMKEWAESSGEDTRTSEFLESLVAIVGGGGGGGGGVIGGVIVVVVVLDEALAYSRAVGHGHDS